MYHHLYLPTLIMIKNRTPQTESAPYLLRQLACALTALRYKESRVSVLGFGIVRMLTAPKAKKKRWHRVELRTLRILTVFRLSLIWSFRLRSYQLVLRSRAILPVV